MYRPMRQLGTAALIAIAACSIASAGDDDSRRERDAYVVTPLTSNLAGHAAMQDPVLQNAWVLPSHPPAAPFWVNDNATGVFRVFGWQDATGTKLPGNGMDT